MISGKSGSFEKMYQIHVKFTLISDVLFRIKNFPVQLASQNLLQNWDNEGPKFLPSVWVGVTSWVLAKVDRSKKVSNSC